MRLLVIIVAMLCASAAYATTLLTFEHTAEQSNLEQIDFTFIDDGIPNNPDGTLTGGNDDVYVVVLVPGPYFGAHPHSRFEIDDLDVDVMVDYPDALYLLGGVLTIYDASDVLLLQVDFDSAILTQQNLSAATITLQNVTFSGPVSEGYMSPYAFSFSLSAMNPTNAWGDTDLAGWSSTSSFTCSAVPEPATIIVMAGGLAIVTGVARKRLYRR